VEPSRSTFDRTAAAKAIVRPTTPPHTAANFGETASDRKEHPVKLTVIRAIPLVAVAAVAALMVSGIGRFKNATHGLDYVVGEIAWHGFLAAALALVVLIAVAVYRRVTRRRAAVASS
jgi:hypothetical protein